MGPGPGHFLRKLRTALPGPHGGLMGDCHSLGPGMKVQRASLLPALCACSCRDGERHHALALTSARLRLSHQVFPE